MQQAYSPERMTELIRRMQKAYSPERMTEITRLMQESYSPERMRAIAEAIERNLDPATAPRTAPASADWQVAVDEAANALAPEPDGRRSLAEWLFWLPIPYQLAILHAGLGLIVEVTKLLEEAGNVDVPDELQAATAMMMALMILVVVLLQARAGPPDD
jgi:hypothetical protein